MKLVIGLGNPGEKHKLTRHNTGSIFLDFLKKTWDFPEFELNKKFNAEISKATVEEKEIILVKPQTFMNLSGESVRSFLDFYKLSPADIIVIHDDLDIETGKYKIATDSSSAGHNGVENIIEKLGTQKFTRFRIGIGKTIDGVLSCMLGAHDYVLQKFPEEEKSTVEKLFPEIEEKIKGML